MAWVDTSDESFPVVYASVKLPNSMLKPEHSSGAKRIYNNKTIGVVQEWKLSNGGCNGVSSDMPGRVLLVWLPFDVHKNEYCYLGEMKFAPVIDSVLSDFAASGEPVQKGVHYQYVHSFRKPLKTVFEGNYRRRFNFLANHFLSSAAVFVCTAPADPKIFKAILSAGKHHIRGAVTSHRANMLHLFCRYQNQYDDERMSTGNDDKSKEEGLLATLLGYCLKEGVNPLKATTKSGSTALHFAARHNTAEVVRALLKNCPEADRKDLIATKDISGWTALHVAAGANKPDIVRALLETCGEDDQPYLVTAVTRSGVTALHLAAYNESQETELVSNILLEYCPTDQKQAFLECTTHLNGLTALHCALLNRSPTAREVCHVLLEHCNPSRKTSYMQQPSFGNWNVLEYAVREGSTEIIEVLKKHCPEYAASGSDQQRYVIR